MRKLHNPAARQVCHVLLIMMTVLVCLSMSSVDVHASMIMGVKTTSSSDFMGYVSALNVDSIVDGTKPFDQDEGDGNDAKDNNRIVRTFDTIKYTVTASFANRDEVTTSTDEVTCFEMTMDKGLTEAKFERSAMSWISTETASWQIEYYAKSEDGGDDEYDLVLIENASGLYYANADGTLGDETSINAIVNGSTGAAPYQMSTNPVVRQRLVGTMPFHNEKNVFDATHEYTAGIYVQNAKNGSTVQPTFRVYFQKNPDNYGKIENGTSTVWTGNQTQPESAVTVSCKPFFNMSLLSTSEYVNYKAWFDFASGDEVKDEDVLAYLQAAGALVENWDKANPAEYTNSENNPDVVAAYGKLNENQQDNLANIRYGRMKGLGITASLASEGGDGTDKGRRGCSLPVGEIKFDLDLDMDPEGTVGDPKTDGYSAILWDYRPNASSDYKVIYEDNNHTREWTDLSKGSMGRNMLWKNEPKSQIGMRATTVAYKGVGDDNAAVYDSGIWSLTAIDGQAKTSSAVTDANSVYTFTLEDYDFDLSNYVFPTQLQSEVSANSLSLGITDFAFFGGFAHVLYVSPYMFSGTVNADQKITLGNLELTTFSGQKLDPSGTQGTTVSSNNEVDATDNTVTNTMTVYSSGKFTKRSSFNRADATNHTAGGSEGSFLGTEFWSEDQQWDENAYAGEDISIVGSAQLSTESDNSIRALNLLQIFDSEALSITPKDGKAGGYITQEDVSFYNQYEGEHSGHDPKLTYLFAADPDRPGGYDTNITEYDDEGNLVYSTVSYMNDVHEEDLIYSDRLYWNTKEERYNIVKDKDDNEYTCVGVLTEVRGCDFTGYCYVRIPVTVADEGSFINSTVCTINGATAWIQEGAMDGISWKNGVWQDGKNTLAGYVDIQSSLNPDDGGVGENGNGYQMYNGDLWVQDLIKIEYNEQGGFKSGTAGKQGGASLLVVGYKAHVEIVDGKNQDGANDKKRYSFPDDTSVRWILTDIKTEIGPDATEGTAETELTIPVRLSYSGKASEDQTLFTIPPDEKRPYRVIGADGSNHVISTNPDDPTTISFTGTNVNDSHVTESVEYTYTIYAVPDDDGLGVTFHLSGVPVNQTLPEIVIDMDLSILLKDNDSITALAQISGSSDHRAYSKTAGNEASDTIYISSMGGSFLSKTVEKEYGELNTDIAYTVCYTNNSENVVGLSYLYDLLPYNNDGRSTNYRGSMTVTGISFANYKIGNRDTPLDFTGSVTAYYSTVNSAILASLLENFNGAPSAEDNQAAIDEILNTGAFQSVGTFSEGNLSYTWENPLSATAIFLKIEGMGSNRDFVMTLETETSDNEAANLYGNNVWHWNTSSSVGLLHSTRVQTQIVAREISGVVWFDGNANGRQDDNEEPIEGVTCTLFKQNEDGSYEICTQNVIGEAISTVDTNESGEYSFGKLAEGNYIVAFSGEVLDKYDGETTYHADGSTEDNNSDGVALVGTETSITGIDGTYKYAIAYSLSESDVGAMEMHNIDYIIDGIIGGTIKNSVELYDHQDLGLVTENAQEFALPDTGGTGVWLIYLVGMMCIVISGGIVICRRHRRKQV